MGRSVTIGDTTISSNTRPPLYEVEKPAGKKDATSAQLERNAQYLQRHYEEKIMEKEKLEERISKLSEQLIRKKEYLDGLQDAAAFGKKVHEKYVGEQLYFEFTSTRE